MNNLSIKKNNELLKRKKKGFTLIELIIVIAIIAILAAIAIPKFGAVRANANLAADQANAKIISTAVSTAISNGEVTTSDTETEVTSAKYLPYIDGNKVPALKSAKGSFFATYSNGNGVKVYVSSTSGTVLYPAS